MDYTGVDNRNWIGNMWQNGDPNAANNAEIIAATNEYCQIVDVKRWLMFLGDGNTNWLSFPGEAEGAQLWTSGAFVLKLTAPEGKIFKGIHFDLKGKNSIDPCVGANIGTSITVSAGDEYESYNVPGLDAFKSSLGTVKRFYSYNNAQGVVEKNVGDLTPFTIVGNNKNEIYVKVTIAGGLDGWNYLSGMKIDGIFAEDSIIDDIEFSGKGAFPTDGTLTAIYKIGEPKANEQMPKSIMFVLAVYEKKENGAQTLVGVKTLPVSNPTVNTDYSVELTGLPQDSNDYCAKAFVWNNDQLMTPIGSVYKLGVE